MAQRFVVYAVCVLLHTIAGLQYIYGTLSVTIKDDFRLKQDIIDNGGLAQNVGANIGIHAGLMFHKFGPKATILTAAGMGCLGYLLLYFSIKLEWNIHDEDYVLYLIMFTQGQGQMFVDMSVVPTVTKLFPGNAGLALGFCKAFLGLGGSLVEAVYLAFFEPHDLAFLGFISVYFPLLCLFGSLYISTNSVGTEETRSYDKRAIQLAFFWGLIPLLCVLLLSTILRLEVGLSKGVQIFFTLTTFTIVALVCLFLASRKDGTNQVHQALETNHASETSHALETDRALETPLIEEEEGQESEASEVIETVQPTTAALIKVFVSPVFWFHGFGVLVSWGAGTLLINNIGQLTQVVGYDKSKKDIFVCLISIFNSIGRILAGAASDYCMSRYGIPRPYFFGCTILSLGVSMLVLSLSTETSLLVATVLTGFLYGALNVLNPAILSDLYGSQNLLQFLYPMVMTFIILGTYVFATKLFSSVYEDHVDTTEDNCVGTHCILWSTRITAILCFATGAAYLGYFKKRESIATQHEI